MTSVDGSASAGAARDTRYLSRPEGRIGYDVAGDGPLVVLVPGMGDLRAAYRFLAPALRARGYRVACTDLRGHGDSDATFSSYGDEETAADVVALITELGGPAVIVATPWPQDPRYSPPPGNPSLCPRLCLSARSSATRRRARCGTLPCA